MAGRVTLDELDGIARDMLSPHDRSHRGTLQRVASGEELDAADFPEGLGPFYLAGVRAAAREAWLAGTGSMDGDMALARLRDLLVGLRQSHRGH